MVCDQYGRKSVSRVTINKFICIYYVYINNMYILCIYNLYVYICVYTLSWLITNLVTEVKVTSLFTL